MIKENNGRILGELDHPEGRFEVSMKEASHMITDLWYDQNTHCVMGRLEVLDTPNGRTLKSLIEAGFPLYVSSRAAGDVNTKTKEVEIAQIFTYDVVCTPGFKEARLERVNESLLTDAALKYINESSNQEGKKAGLKAIDVPADAINENVEKYANTTLADVCTPLNEEDESANDNKKEDKDNLNDAKQYLRIMNTSGNGSNAIKEEDGDNNENSEDNKSEEHSDENSEENKDENSEEDNKNENSEEKEELSDEEKEANRENIVTVEGFDKDGNKLGDSEENDKKDDIENIEGKTEDDENSEENKDENSEEENKDEKSEETSEEVTSEASKAEEKSSKIKKEVSKDVAELESILASVQKKESVKESICRRYPFASVLTEGNYAKFAALRPKLKKRISDFLDEYEIYDIQAINELWMTPLKEEKAIQQNWLKLASQSDIDLYVSAPVEVQNAIEEQAQLFVLETEEDVDSFWNATGLRQQAMRKAMNEKMVNDYNTFVSEVNEGMADELGYDPYLIRATELMMQNDKF